MGPEDSEETKSTQTLKVPLACKGSREQHGMHGADSFPCRKAFPMLLKCLSRKATRGDDQWVHPQKRDIMDLSEVTGAGLGGHRRSLLTPAPRLLPTCHAAASDLESFSCTMVPLIFQL